MPAGAPRAGLGRAARRGAGELGDLLEEAVTMFSAFQLACAANGHEVRAEGVRALERARRATADAYLRVWDLLDREPALARRLPPAMRRARLQAEHARVALAGAPRPHSLIYPPSLPLPQAVSFFGTEACPALDLLSLRPGSLVALDEFGNGTRAIERLLLVPLLSRLSAAGGPLRSLRGDFPPEAFTRQAMDIQQAMADALEPDRPRLVKLYVVTRVWFEAPALPEDALRYLGSFPGPVNEAGRPLPWVETGNPDAREIVEEEFLRLPWEQQEALANSLQLPPQLREKLQLWKQGSARAEAERKPVEINIRRLRPSKASEARAVREIPVRPRPKDPMEVWRDKFEAGTRRAECAAACDLMCPRLRQAFRSSRRGRWAQMTQLRDGSHPVPGFAETSPGAEWYRHYLAMTGIPPRGPYPEYLESVIRTREQQAREQGESALEALAVPGAYIGEPESSSSGDTRTRVLERDCPSYFEGAQPGMWPGAWPGMWPLPWPMPWPGLWQPWVPPPDWEVPGRCVSAPAGLVELPPAPWPLAPQPVEEAPRAQTAPGASAELAVCEPDEPGEPLGHHRTHRPHRPHRAHRPRDREPPGEPDGPGSPADSENGEPVAPETLDPRQIPEKEEPLAEQEDPEGPEAFRGHRHHRSHRSRRAHAGRRGHRERRARDNSEEAEEPESSDSPEEIPEEAASSPVLENPGASPAPHDPSARKSGGKSRHDNPAASGAADAPESAEALEAQESGPRGVPRPPGGPGARGSPSDEAARDSAEAPETPGTQETSESRESSESRAAREAKRARRLRATGGHRGRGLKILGRPSPKEDRILKIPERLLRMCQGEGYSEDYLRAVSGMRIGLGELRADESEISAWRERARESGDPEEAGQRPLQPMVPFTELAGSSYSPAWLLRPPRLGEKELVVNQVDWPMDSGEELREAILGHRTVMDILPLADPEQDGLVYCPEAGEECLAFHQVAGHFRKCTVITEPSRLTRFHARVCFATRPVWVVRDGKEVLEWVPNTGREQRHSDVYARFLIPFPGAAVTRNMGAALMMQWMRLGGPVPAEPPQSVAVMGTSVQGWYPFAFSENAAAMSPAE